MGSPPIRPTALLASSLLLFLAACATARTNRFAEYGRAGTAYADAVDGLLAEAAAAAVDADSEVLIASREALEAAERARAVERHHALLEARLAVVDRLRRHARALGAVAGFLTVIGRVLSP
ncbi:MAG: hypothetical protein R3199_08475 [Gemmatimonadota bacterium]|nr:hypothetical protein [Gemmatimonadota bacterium]